jgi:hypothetical protein
MIFKSWRNVAELVGIAAIVASLVFVGLQMRQDQEIAIVETYGALSEATINLTILVGDNMDVWQKGLEGEDLSQSQRGVFISLLASVEKHYQRMFIRWSRLGPGDPEDIASEFAYALYLFPGMRDAYKENNAFDLAKDAARGFDDQLNPWEPAIDKYLAKFDDEQPPAPAIKAYIFWGF